MSSSYYACIWIFTAGYLRKPLDDKCKSIAAVLHGASGSCKRVSTRPCGVLMSFEAESLYVT